MATVPYHLRKGWRIPKQQAPPVQILSHGARQSRVSRPVHLLVKLHFLKGGKILRLLCIPFVIASLLFVIGVPAVANELDDHCFIDGASTTAWEYSPSVLFNGNGDPDKMTGLKFGRGHIAWDPAGYGESGWMRQIVDDMRGNWNPNYNHKIADISFGLYTTGPAYVQVGIDWWDDATQPTKPARGAVAPHFELLPTQYTSVDDWTDVNLTFDWAGKPGDQQPRWVSLEFFFFGCSQTGFEAAVDDVSFVGTCVPEPSSMLALSGGLIGLVGLIARKRR